MPMYNLIECSDNYADSSGSLYQFKRDESPMNDAENPLNFALDNSTSFKYKTSLLGKATDADGNDRSLKNTKIVVPLKYLFNFFRSLEMPLINFKVHLELNWNNNCVMYSANTCTYQLKDNVNLRKRLNEGFKRSVYWNEYKSKIETKEADTNNLKRFPLDASFNRLFRSYF